MPRADRRNGRYWICTLRADGDTPPALPEGACYIKGQKERGGETGYEHWQFIVYFNINKRFATVRAALPEGTHIELTRSDAAEQYV